MFAFARPRPGGSPTAARRRLETNDPGLAPGFFVSVLERHQSHPRPGSSVLRIRHVLKAGEGGFRPKPPYPHGQAMKAGEPLAGVLKAGAGMQTV